MAGVSDEDLAIAFQSAAMIVNRFFLNVNTDTVRLTFAEEVPLDSGMKLYPRGAVVMDTANAIALRDLLVEMLKDAKPITPGPETKQ